MIPSMRFRHIVIDELSLHFDTPTDAQIDDLYKLFCNNSELILERAVKLLKRSHKYKRFPFPADIQIAINHANMERARDSIDPDKPREYCDKCYGMGIKLTKKFDEMYGVEMEVASPCHCSEGDKIRRGWREHYRTHKYYRAERRRERKVEAL